MIPNTEHGDVSAPQSRLLPGRYLLTAILLSIVLAAGGCGLLGGEQESAKGNAQQDAAPADSPAPADGAVPEKSEGPCANPYYPVDPGKVRRYKLDSKVPDGDREYTLKQKMVDDNTFAEERSFSSGLDVSVNWNCTENGLRTAEYLSQAQMPAGSFQMETVESSGITIPSKWELGNEWESRYVVKADLNAGPVKASANGTVTLGHKLAAVDEVVSVAGGEFKANRVDTVIRMDLSMKGTAIPSKEIKMSVWYSPEVGLVKQQVYGDFGDEKVEFTGFE